MKIIFLDIDGVLNNQDITNFHKGKVGDEAYDVFDRDDLFDPKCVNNLNSIIEATGAKIVISSSWRVLFDINELRDILANQKVNGEIIDHTNRFGCERGHEIQEWLDRHPDVSSFVMLDDGTDMAHLIDRLVNTDFEKGLEEKHIEEAIKMLGT